MLLKLPEEMCQFMVTASILNQQGHMAFYVILNNECCIARELYRFLFCLIKSIYIINRSMYFDNFRPRSHLGALEMWILQDILFQS